MKLIMRKKEQLEGAGFQSRIFYSNIKRYIKMNICLVASSNFISLFY